MSYSKQAARYRDVTILSASPEQLVVLVFEHLLVTLRKARMAMMSGQIEERGVQLARAREIIGELLATLDMERGAQIAASLRSLYVFLLTELLDLGRTPDVVRLDRISAMIGELHGAFASAADGLVQAKQAAR